MPSSPIRPGQPPDRARQPGRRGHQRHRRAGPGQHRPAGRQAGDGRQGRAVQEVRRHRRLRHRTGRARRRQADRHDRRHGADLRRHQPGGHQGAGVLLHRGQAARAHEDPGLPRRPARHGHRRRRGDAQRPASWSARTSSEVKLVTSGAGAAALACLDLLVNLGVRVENIWVTDIEGVVYEGRTRTDGPDQGALRQEDRRAHAGRGHRGRRCLPRPVGRRRAEARHGGEDGRRIR